MVMVDTSVWIEYFKSRPRIDTHKLDALILEVQVSTCLPIYAEVLSGQMNAQTRIIVEEIFKAMNVYNLDWNQMDLWEKLSEMARRAFSNRIPPCGLVDRMILGVCKEYDLQLWTIDKKLKTLGEFVDVACV